MVNSKKLGEIDDTIKNIAEERGVYVAIQEEINSIHETSEKSMDFFKKLEYALEEIKNTLEKQLKKQIVIEKENFGMDTSFYTIKIYNKTKKNLFLERFRIFKLTHFVTNCSYDTSKYMEHLCFE